PAWAACLLMISDKDAVVTAQNLPGNRTCSVPAAFARTPAQCTGWTVFDIRHYPSPKGRSKCSGIVFATETPGHGQEISTQSSAPRTHLLGLRQVLPGGFDDVRQWLQPHPAPQRNHGRRLA